MNPNSYQPTVSPTLHNPFPNASTSSSREQYGDNTDLSTSPEKRVNLAAHGESAAGLTKPDSPPSPGLRDSNPVADKPSSTTGDASSKLALELKQFTTVASQLRQALVPAATFSGRCQQAFDVANDLFANAPTWICFYRELMGGNGMLSMLFDSNKDFGAFLRTDQHHQIQLMLTALRSRDLPENDPNDPQRMITVRLPKSLHEAMCEEAGRLNISVNRLCISRMLQLLDPEMIPETHSKPRGRKPRTQSKPPASGSHTPSGSHTASSGYAAAASSHPS